ncbi:putative epimerase/dehydratase [Actinorhabdospora filicis]|uniref:Epimerase/dehydratase n=1 Tax=Actinorhabdospora filicis TaxID=1785913 RepID=A0A9W6STY8_9ACTN|nr:NAD(P)H-binding protein [Actinorhabdospora filicis]GLZ80696.1 putative epimerase/dehydratase [Actinorhabdospora filicis]
MRIVVFGAAGRGGGAVVEEAVSRGHDVLAVARRPIEAKAPSAVGDITDAASVAALVSGADVVVSSVYDGNADATAFYTAAAESLVGGGVRTVHVTLSTLRGPSRLVDAPEFPEVYRGFNLGHAAGLERLAASGLEWTAISPVTDFDAEAGRSGGYELDSAALTGMEQLGERKVSFADFAIAVVDEAEKGAHVGSHIGVGPA